ncbi:MAG: hypothetical protein QM817_09295 [Archangium sp.]
MRAGVIIAAVVAASAASSTALACSCASTDAETGVADGHAVFTGKIRASVEIGFTLSRWALVDVDRTWGRQVSGFVVLQLPLTNCGIPDIDRWSEWLFVGATEGGNVVQTTACEVNVPIGYAAPVIAKLGDSRRPTSLGFVCAPVLLVCTIAGFVVLRRRRRR